MILVLIFVLSDKVNKGLDLFRKLYKVAKIIDLNKVYDILGDHLRINFWFERSIFYRIRDRFIEIKDYYLLYYNYLLKLNEFNRILKSEFLIEGIMYSCYCFSPQKLLEFTTFMTDALRKTRSKNLVLGLINIYERLFLLKGIERYT